MFDVICLRPGSLVGETVKPPWDLRHQVNDHALDFFADDIAALGLDLLMPHAGWLRCGQNPFLLGY